MVKTFLLRPHVSGLHHLQGPGERELGWRVRLRTGGRRTEKIAGFSTADRNVEIWKIQKLLKSF
jgi:hypothetical protein